ncbi:MAG: hypothetical protein HDT01_04720, partial [Bacteroidales bacterium]|nr:hypothetical protein [Bacteroidales bacterium]
MKTNKFNFSDYDEVSRDEMRDMVSTSSGPLPPIDSGSGSGSGSDASPEVIACNGKTVGDECYFTGINDLSYKGTCDYGSLHQQLYCHTNYVSSGSGAIKESPEVEACKNKGAGEACQWTTAGGSSFNGKCLSGTLHKG